MSSNGRTRDFESRYRGSNPCVAANSGRFFMLPELPKKYSRKEAKIDGRVAQWFYDNHPHSVLLEVKIKGGKLKEHQERLLASVGKLGKFMYKFKDGGARTPLDYVILKNADAVLAVCDGNTCECTVNNKQKFTIKV